jgi:itaconate CoA-transferase
VYTDRYRAKLTTPAEAAAFIDNGSTLVHGMTSTEPPALLEAVADRLRAGDLEDLSVYSLLPMNHMARTLLAPDLADKVKAFAWFVGLADREQIRAGINYFVPNEFHQLPRICREFMDIDVVMTTVSPMDKSGFFTFGLANDYISTAARHCRKLIVEVNPRMPRVFGDSLLHIDEVDVVVEHEADLIEITPTPPRPEAETIGRAIAGMIPDGATLQLGVGGIPDAVTDYLGDHRDLGIHTELFCPGMVRLIKKGVVTGRKKNLHPGKHVFTNALGDKEMFEFMDDNPSLESYPVSYTNAPETIARNDQMISINSTLEVDLLGQCNSEFLGGHEFSGTGGQLDYVRGAFNSKGGKSIIAFYSTTHDGQVSRVVPRFAPGTVVTTPRMDTHWLATEYGMVDLKGKSTRERALGVIALAHPDFRDELMSEAKKMNLI